MYTCIIVHVHNSFPHHTLIKALFFLEGNILWAHPLVLKLKAHPCRRERGIERGKRGIEGGRELMITHNSQHPGRVLQTIWCGVRSLVQLCTEGDGGGG